MEASPEMASEFASSRFQVLSGWTQYEQILLRASEASQPFSLPCCHIEVISIDRSRLLIKAFMQQVFISMCNIFDSASMLAEHLRWPQIPDHSRFASANNDRYSHLLVAIFVTQGLTRPSESWGLPPCQDPDAQGAWLLLFGDVVHYVLVTMKFRGLPAAVSGMAGHRAAQPPGDLRRLSNPGPPHRQFLCGLNMKQLVVS